MKIIRCRTWDGRICLASDYKDGTAVRLGGNLFQGLRDTGEPIQVKTLLAPLEPAAVFCIGLNYERHAAEANLPLPEYPAVFMKNPAAITGPDSPVLIPHVCREIPEVDYEAELGVVIGTKAKNVSEEKALEYVAGYVCANDISARRWQKHAGAGQWVRGKSFDTFCPLGPFLVTADEIEDVQNLSIQCLVNGKMLQDSNTNDMIFSVARIIAYLSESTTLLPGTLILTGTPEGVGFVRNPPVYLAPGDMLETRIQDMGVLKNPVVAESSGLNPPLK